jgi:hypothetical protein
MPLPSPLAAAASAMPPDSAADDARRYYFDARRCSFFTPRHVDVLRQMMTIALRFCSDMLHIFAAISSFSLRQKMPCHAVSPPLSPPFC